MRIGIDGRYIQDHFPGIGRYTYNLILALADIIGNDTLVVIHNPRLPNTRYELAPLRAKAGIELIETDVSTFSLIEQWALPRLAKRLDLDIWHAPYYIGPYYLPCPMVVTIHDAISSRYPHYLPSLAARAFYDLTMRLALHSASHVIADSRASADDVVHFFSVRPPKISVIYPAADPRYRPQLSSAVAETRTRLGLPEDYVLYLGMNKPHKNLARLVQAWERLRQMNCPGLESLELIIAGREDPRYPQARQAAERLGPGAGIRFLGDIAEGDLPALYSGAMLFVFPSLYEGFGLPVLEAMACGTPVVCSTAPALREIVADAAITFDPLDVEAMAHAMQQVLTDVALRRDLTQRGLEQAARFSWHRTAEETISVYKAVAHGRK